MTFEFLIVCDKKPESNIGRLIAESLTQASSDFDESMVQVRHERTVNDVSGNNGNIIVGFTLELPEYVTDNDISEFTAKLLDSSQVFHVVKFEDPLLQRYLAERAEEIFALEMKLRRVLSLAYLNAYRLENPFELLREERRENQPQNRPDLSHMSSVSENQFFHLLFGQYADLNRRQEPTNISNLLGYIRSSKDYTDFHTEISRRPIKDDEDARLIEKLKEIIDPIEEMRNCVAHNRHPSRSTRNNYPQKHDQLKELLDTYLAHWKVQEQDTDTLPQPSA